MPTSHCTVTHCLVVCHGIHCIYILDIQWNLGIRDTQGTTVLNSEVVLFLRSISMCWIGLGTEVAVLNSQAVPISQVVLKTGFTVLCISGLTALACSVHTCMFPTPMQYIHVHVCNNYLPISCMIWRGQTLTQNMPLTQFPSPPPPHTHVQIKLYFRPYLGHQSWSLFSHFSGSRGNKFYLYPNGECSHVYIIGPCSINELIND